MERERAAWREESEQSGSKARIAAVWAAGPTVDEESFLEDLIPKEPEINDTDGGGRQTWTEEEELEAKLRHLKDVIEASDSFDVIGKDEKGDALVLSITWAGSVRDTSLKARLCARDFANERREDLFAPGSTSLTSRVIDLRALHCNCDSYTIDVTAAYNRLEEPENVVVIPLREWLQERERQGLSTDVPWKMKKLLLGRRIAARQWVDFMGGVLKGARFSQSLGHPHLFRDVRRDLTCELHMDDIHGCGPTSFLDEHLKEMEEQLPLKRAVGHTVGDTYERLKKTHSIKAGGRCIQPSTRYVFEIARRLGFEKCKPAITPESEAIKPTLEDAEDPLNDEQASEYRSLTCTLLFYAAHGIVEAQHGVRNLTMDLKALSAKSWELISTDTGWAGCKRTRKSCGMTVIRVGGCVLYIQCTV